LLVPDKIINMRHGMMWIISESIKSGVEFINVTAQAIRIRF
jgi:hypothetical protein